MNLLPTHRIALEPRSGPRFGIWLLFYETLCDYRPVVYNTGHYKIQLIRIFGHRIKSELRFEAAKLAALKIISDRNIESPLIVRDDSQKNEMLRKA